LTSNSLIVLQDGVYIELYGYLHPPSYYPVSSPERQKRESHHWADKVPGWLDYALLGVGLDSEPQISEVINKRAAEEDSETHFFPEEAGARKRPDGKVVEWNLTGPDPKHGRGTLPFFCGDVTPRELRVPSDPPSNTQHPSGALGISHVRVLANAETFSRDSRQLTTILGAQPVSNSPSEVVWKLDTVNTVPSLGTHGYPKLVLNIPRDDEERSHIARAGTGIYEVGFWVEKGREGGIVQTPHGKLVWSPIVNN
jgi:hypothetical protein